MFLFCLIVSILWACDHWVESGRGCSRLVTFLYVTVHQPTNDVVSSRCTVSEFACSESLYAEILVFVCCYCTVYKPYQNMYANLRAVFCKKSIPQIQVNILLVVNKVAIELASLIPILLPLWISKFWDEHFLSLHQTMTMAQLSLMMWTWRARLSTTNLQLFGSTSCATLLKRPCGRILIFMQQF